MLLKDEIKTLKEKLDSQESAERMRCHELNKLRRESKANHDQVLIEVVLFPDNSSEILSVQI